MVKRSVFLAALEEASNELVEGADVQAMVIAHDADGIVVRLGGVTFDRVAGSDVDVQNPAEPNVVATMRYWSVAMTLTMQVMVTDVFARSAEQAEELADVELSEVVFRPSSSRWVVEDVNLSDVDEVAAQR